MREIDLIWTKSKKRMAIGSWAIRFWVTVYRFIKTGKFIREDNSHCAIRFSSRIFSTPTYYQASEGLVNYMSGTQFDKKHQFVKGFRIPVPDDLYGQLRDECHDEAGAPYGLLQNLGIFLTDIADLFGYDMENPWKTGRNCSELMYVRIVLRMIGSQGYSKDKIKPDQLYTAISNNIDKLKAVVINK